MSTVERLTELLASDKLTIEEKQTVQDAIRLIQALQAARIAAYEISVKKGGAA